jgi:hypothetical protein
VHFFQDYFYDVDACEHLTSFLGDCDRKTEQSKVKDVKINRKPFPSFTFLNIQRAVMTILIPFGQWIPILVSNPDSRSKKQCMAPQVEQMKTGGFGA